MRPMSRRIIGCAKLPPPIPDVVLIKSDFVTLLVDSSRVPLSSITVSENFPSAAVLAPRLSAKMK